METFFKKSIMVQLILFLSISLVVIPQVNAKTDYPQKTIQWIVPFGPGGGYDAYSRAVARVLPKYLPNKVNVVVKNVPGGGSRRGSATVYRSKPDGYTIGIVNPLGLATSDIVKKSDEYDLLKFTYLANTSIDESGLFVGKDSKYQTLKELQEAKVVKFITGGKGSSTWLAGVLCRNILKINVSWVSGYEGTGTYTTALIRGDADAFSFTSSSGVLPYIKSGDIKPVFIFVAEKQWDLYPNAPTLHGTPYAQELNKFPTYRMVVGPPDLPAEITSILEKALLEAMADNELKEWSQKTDFPMSPKNGAGSKQMVKEAITLLEKYQDWFKAE